ncbi:MAG: hypothetical protein WA782_10500 [Sulfitobacter sp.]
MTNVTDTPREIALAAAQRLKTMISHGKHDLYLQQAMRSAHLVVLRSGIMITDDGQTENHFDGSLTLH